MRHSTPTEYKLKPEAKQPIVNDDIQTAPEVNRDRIQFDATEAAQKDGKAAPSKGSFFRQRGWLLVMGVMVLATGGMFGWRWWQFQQTHASTDNAQIEGHISPVSARITGTVQKVLVQNGDYVRAGQTLVVLEDQDLNLQVQQAKADLAAAQADLKGATDTVPFTQRTNTTQVQQAESGLVAKQAGVRAAQTNINQANAGVRAAQGRLNQSDAAVKIARAKVAQAQTEVNKTGADFRRYAYLYQQGAISAQQRDTAQAALKNAQADLNAAQAGVRQAQAEVSSSQAQLRQAQAQVNTTQAQLQQAQADANASSGKVAETKVAGQQVKIQRDQANTKQAQVAKAEAALALARQQLRYTVIKAPVTGYVGKSTAEVGQKVQPQQPLLSVTPLQGDEIYVEANFKETELKGLQIGEAAEVKADAFPGQVFPATVAGISPATGSSFALLPPDNATGNFTKVVQWVPVRLIFEPGADPLHKLRAGLSVTVTVDTKPDTGS